MATIQELIHQAGTKQYDRQAKVFNFMVGIPGELYTRSLSKSSAVYVELISNHWEAWRETYQKGRQLAISERTIAKGQTLEHVLMNAKRYFDFIESKRRRSNEEKSN